EIELFQGIAVLSKSNSILRTTYFVRERTMFSKSRSAPRAALRAFLFQPANLSVRRRSTHRHHNAPVFLTLTVRSSATKEQLRLGYFGVRFRTRKYAVSYFFG